MPNSVHLVPLWLAELSEAATERAGFLALYARNGALKLVADDGAAEVDAVLDRVLQGYQPLNASKARAIKSTDSVLTALALLQAQLQAVKVNPLTAAELYSLLEAEDGIFLTLTNHNTVLISMTPGGRQNQYVEPGYVSDDYVL